MYTRSCLRRASTLFLQCNPTPSISSHNSSTVLGRVMSNATLSQSAKSDTTPKEEKETTSHHHHGEGRKSFPHFLKIPTQWRDNDQYGHVNNVVYYAWMDAVINDYLIKKGGLQPTQSEVVGYCVESQCKIGRSSVTYHIGFFKEGQDDGMIAHGHFVHVFVNKETNRPTDIPHTIREALLSLQV